MKSKNVRTIVAAAVFVILSAGLIGGISFGTLSGFGWGTISALCPLGALGTMIATKTMVPRALVSLVIMGLLVFLFGRAFCGWLCPVGLIDRIRDFFRSPKKRRAMEQRAHDEALAVANQELGKFDVKAGCGSKGCGSCTACQPQKHGKLDTRHAVLGGALLSTAIFGFPVFCLVCPVGLTFATVLVVWRLFAVGETTLSVILIPLLLIVELVFLRKWCTRFCPLSALMNLVSRFSRTTVPVIDNNKCLETSKGAACSRCAMVCEADINLRHPDFGERTLADCTRCRACVDACPSGAISMPFIAKKDGTVQIADRGVNEETKA